MAREVFDFPKSVRPHKVDVIPLSEVIFNSGPVVDLLKIDCEGCEYVSLKDAFKKEALKNVNNIIVETHGNSYRILSMLQEASFEVKKIIGSGYNQIIYASNHILF